MSHHAPDARDRAHDDAFDAHVRGLHAEALRRLPQRTLAQLRPRAAAATAVRGGHGRAWALAAVGAAVFALAIGLRPAAPPADPAPSRIVAVDALPNPDEFDAAAVALEEDPDLFLWLASSDAQPLAME